jgi:DNA-binding beta-propeller fold protein YncE
LGGLTDLIFVSFAPSAWITTAMSRRLTALLLMLLMPLAQGAQIDKSDLNGDGAVDTQDIELFSSRYLGQDWMTVDWCAFYESSISNPKYFRQIVSDKIEHYQLLLNLIAETFECTVVVPTGDKSDLDGDNDVDLDDLVIFSINYLERHWESVDWCVFHGSTLAGVDFEGRSTRYYLQHFTLLLTFINTYFECGGAEPPANGLALENAPKFLTRIEVAANGNFYVTDPRLGSLFIFDEFLVLQGEIKGLNKPLGVAVDMQGRILVGNDGRDNVEVYDPANGDLLAVFGDGLVKMPTAITLDGAGNIYVTDSRRDRVQVFDSAFNPIRTIGKGGNGDDTLSFPMDVEIINQEIFVADQGGYRVQVFDFNGNWQRSITFDGTPGQNCNWMGVCEIPGMPPFTKVQALSRDSLGRLHVLDNFAASVMIFDPANDDAFVSSYGAYGDSAGQLRVPMDVKVLATDMAVVTSGDGDRIELFAIQ